MNIAALFSSYKLLAAELERERTAHAATIKRAEEKERQLTDGLMRAINKTPVYDRPDPVPVSNVPAVAFGPTMSLQRQEAKESEREAGIIQRAEEARRNGQKVDIPVIPSK